MILNPNCTIPRPHPKHPGPFRIATAAGLAADGAGDPSLSKSRGIQYLGWLKLVLSLIAAFNLGQGTVVALCGVRVFESPFVALGVCLCAARESLALCCVRRVRSLWR